jgi:hypothetical protein
MEELLLEYLPILIFIGLAAVLGGLIVVPLVVAPSKPDPRNCRPMNVVFAFGDARMKFDVRFYLVAILFIVFDLKWPSVSGDHAHRWRRRRTLRLLVDDGVPGCADGRLYL